MTFKERLFICKAGHPSKYWAWDNEQSIICRRQRCRLKAHRALVGHGRNAQNAQPFVYYQSPTGEIFVAATAADTRHPKGYVRKEIRTMHEYSKFRREHSERNSREAEITRELDKQQRAEANEVGRDALRSMIPHLSREGQDLARAAIEESYRDSVDRVNTDCYISGFEDDRGNRNPYEDEQHNYRRAD